MYSIGKINQKIYKCITEDIITEEVIIIDNQIQHIKDRHPEAYNKVLKNIQEAIMLMYGREASNRKQEIDRQHHTIPNKRTKDKHYGNVHNRLWNHG